MDSTRRSQTPRIRLALSDLRRWCTCRPRARGLHGRCGVTIPEITAYVMALPVEDVRRLSATDVMGWHEQVSHTGKLSWQGPGIAILVHTWRPDDDRNQSRMVTDKLKLVGTLELTEALTLVTGTEYPYLYDITPDQETRAALIAHMIHKQEATNDPN